MNITLNKKRGRPPKPVAQTSPKPERLEIKLSILKAAIQASPDIHREDVRKAILTIVDEAARLTPEKRFLFLQFNTNAARRLERKIVREICAMNDKSSKTNLLEVSNEAGVYVVAGNSPRYNGYYVEIGVKERGESRLPPLHLAHDVYDYSLIKGVAPTPPPAPPAL